MANLSSYATATPVLTDYASGIDDPGGTPSVKNFTFTAVRDLLQANLTKLTISSDAILERDAANTLAQRNGTAAQTFNIYNTFTDASNYERGVMRWASNLLEIGTENTGTGSSRQTVFVYGGVERFRLRNAGVKVTGELVADGDNSRDLGSSSVQWRNLYLGTGLILAGGTPLKKVLSATAALDFPSIATNSTQDLTVTVTGAVAGDAVFVGPPAALEADLIVNAFVSAADTVTVRAANVTGGAIDPASGTYRVVVMGF